MSDQIPTCAVPHPDPTTIDTAELIRRRDSRGDLGRALQARGWIRMLRGGGSIGDQAYQTVRHGWADAIEPHVPGAELHLLTRGSPYAFSFWASVHPAHASDPEVLLWLGVWGQMSALEADERLAGGVDRMR